MSKRGAFWVAAFFFCVGACAGMIMTFIAVAQAISEMFPE